LRIDLIKIEIYTDGACSGNPGIGAWAAVIFVDGDYSSDHVGFEKHTTNNRMELQAVIEGLSHVTYGGEVTLFSDSQYVIKTMTEGWRKRVNLDLWNLLDIQNRQLKVTWKWVKGHSGNYGNELANRFAQGLIKDITRE